MRKITPGDGCPSLTPYRSAVGSVRPNFFVPFVRRRRSSAGARVCNSLGDSPVLSGWVPVTKYCNNNNNSNDNDSDNMHFLCTRVRRRVTHTSGARIVRAVRPGHTIGNRSRRRAVRGSARPQSPAIELYAKR